jgi:hypothetical protein
LGKEVLTCATTSNDYMQAFRQLTLYYVFLSGRSRTSLDRDELQLCKVSQSNDPLQMAIVIVRLAPSSSYTSRILHLEDEKVFGSVKPNQNLPLGLEGNSHKHDRVNFSRP